MAEAMKKDDMCAHSSNGIPGAGYRIWIWPRRPKAGRGLQKRGIIYSRERLHDTKFLKAVLGLVAKCIAMVSISSLLVFDLVSLLTGYHSNRRKGER